MFGVYWNNLVLDFFEAFFIKFHPQITDSLFAIKSFLLFLTISIVGSNPSIPGIADKVTSDNLSDL